MASLGSSVYYKLPLKDLLVCLGWIVISNDQEAGAHFPQEDYSEIQPITAQRIMQQEGLMYEVRSDA